MVKKSVLEKNKYQFIEKNSLSALDDESVGYDVEIEAYLQELKSFKISLMSLSKHVPNKEDRNLLLNIALIIQEKEDLKNQFLQDKKLPLKRISVLVEVPIFKLQGLEKYLGAYILLLGDKYPLLKKTLTYGPKVKEHLTEVMKFMPQGLVLKCDSLQCYLLTKHGEFYRIRNQDQVVGKTAVGTKKRDPLNLRKPLSFLLVISIVLFAFYQVQSKKIENTIIIRAEGEVKMEFNSFGELIKATGTTPLGDLFVSFAEFEDKDMDTVLAEIIEQAYITENIKERDQILIIISGEPLAEDFFKQGKTHDRIISYQLNPKINNSGSSLDLN